MARNKSNKAWLREHVTDPYVRRAQAEGYRARSAYKLLQLNERDRLLKPGMVIVDLGAAPGGWSQVASEITGPRGRVIALDLLEMAPIAGVAVIRGDFAQDDALRALAEELGGAPVDLVLSDMAPNLSGIAATDQARSIALAELALEFASAHLKLGGAMLVKAFQGEGFQEFVAELRRSFEKVATRKPEASRSRSSEVYLLATGKRPARAGEEE